MKIITLKYNRQHSAVQQSTLMSSKAFASSHLYRLEQNNTDETQAREKVQMPKQQEYIIRGHWH